ncbi:MAG: MBL fold metallo-hydrolase [bacterium]
MNLRKRSLFCRLAVVAWLLACACAQVRLLGAERDESSAERVADTQNWPTTFRLWSMTLGCTCYVIAPTNSRSAIIIDPGTEPLALIRFLEQTNLVVKYVLLTHDHWDHAQAVPAIMKRYKDATLICHEHCPEFAGLRSKVGQFRVAGIKGHGLDNRTGTITLEGITLKACRITEHSIGHVLYYLESGKERYFFSGDLGQLPATFTCGNDKVRQYLPNLPKIVVVLPGHGLDYFASFVADLLGEKQPAPAPAASTNVKTAAASRAAAKAGRGRPVGGQ